MNKQLTINMAFQVISFALNIIISFFLTQYLVNRIGSEAFGFVGLANNFVQYVELFTVVLNSMASRFITIKVWKGDYLQANKYFTSVFWGNLIIIAVLVPISFTVIYFLESIINISSRLIFDVKILWVFITVNFMTTLISSLYGVALFSKNRLDLLSITNAISYLIKAIILFILFYFFKPSIWFVGLASLCASLFVLTTIKSFKRKLLPEIQIQRKYFNIAAIKELITSGMWSSVSKLSGILSSGLDLLVANVLIGSMAMGVLSVAKTIPILIISTFTVMANVFAPQLTIYYAKEQSEEIEKSLMLSIKLLAVFSGVILAGFMVLARDFYRLWLPNEDPDLLMSLSIAACIHLIILMPIQPLNNIFTTVNKLKAPSLSVLVSGTITIIAEITLIPLFDDFSTKLLIIILSSTVCELVRVSVFLPLYSAKCLAIKWTTFYYPIARNIISILILIASYKFLLSLPIILTDSWFGLIKCAILFIILGIFINIMILLSSEERQKLSTIFKQKIKGVSVTRK